MFCQCDCQDCKILIPYNKFKKLCAKCDQPRCNQYDHIRNIQKMNNPNMININSSTIGSKIDIAFYQLANLVKNSSTNIDDIGFQIKYFVENGYCSSCVGSCMKCTLKYHTGCSLCIGKIIKQENICVCAQPMMYDQIFDDLIQCNGCELKHPILPNSFNVVHLLGNKYYCDRCTATCFVCNKRNILELCCYCAICSSIFCDDCSDHHICKMMDINILLILQLTSKKEYYEYKWQLRRQLSSYRLLCKQIDLFIVNGLSEIIPTKKCFDGIHPFNKLDIHHFDTDKVGD